MQNGSVSGLPRDYILQQLGDFRSGKRHTADPNKANGYEMQAIARNLTDAEAQAAADYFSSVKYTKWVRVVESESIPKFTATVNGLFLKDEGNETIPLGNRIVEMPEDTYQTKYPPQSSLGFCRLCASRQPEERRGARHVGEMRDVPWCRPARDDDQERHRAADSPGRSPSYIGRAIYDFQQGARSGANAALMKPSVQRLTETTPSHSPPISHRSNRKHQGRSRFDVGARPRARQCRLSFGCLLVAVQRSSTSNVYVRTGSAVGPVAR
jgi:cytochrome c553